MKMNKPKGKSKNPAKIKERKLLVSKVKREEQDDLLGKRATPPPVIVVASVNKCPLCSYTTVSGLKANIARHFQWLHKLEFRQILTGQATYEGIKIKEGLSDEIAQEVIAAMTRKIEAAARAATKRRPHVKPVLVRSTLDKCPCCEYRSNLTTNIARHFQNRHKVELKQVLEGTVRIPGILKKEASGEVSRPSYVLDYKDQKEKAKLIQKLWAEQSQSKLNLDSCSWNTIVKQEPEENPNSTALSFHPPGSVKRRTQSKKTSRNNSHEIPESESRAGSVCGYESSGSQSHSFNSFSLVPDDGLMGEGQVNVNAMGQVEVETPSQSVNVTPCPVSNCGFSTDSQYILQIHENFHQMLDCMSPFVKTIIQASGNYNFVMKKELQSPFEAFSAGSCKRIFLEKRVENDLPQ